MATIAKTGSIPSGVRLDPPVQSEPQRCLLARIWSCICKAFASLFSCFGCCRSEQTAKEPTKLPPSIQVQPQPTGQTVKSVELSNPAVEPKETLSTRLTSQFSIEQVKQADQVQSPPASQTVKSVELYNPAVEPKVTLSTRLTSQSSIEQVKQAEIVFLYEHGDVDQGRMMDEIHAMAPQIDEDKFARICREDIGQVAEKAVLVYITPNNPRFDPCILNRFAGKSILIFLQPTTDSSPLAPHLKELPDAFILFFYKKKGQFYRGGNNQGGLKPLHALLQEKLSDPA